MRTEQLIAALAADAPAPPFRPAALAAAILAVAAVSAALFLVAAGPRPDLAAALAVPTTLAKTLLSALVAAVALALAFALARPDRHRKARLWWLALPAAAAAGLWLQGFAMRAPEQRFAEMTPFYVAECFGLIVALSIPAAIVALRLLRRGASLSPALSGALTGLGVSAAAATGYSFFCTQDNPVFYVTWYGAAMLAVSAACAWAGRRYLAW